MTIKKKIVVLLIPLIGGCGTLLGIAVHKARTVAYKTQDK